MGACAEHGILGDAKGVASIETPPPQFHIVEGSQPQEELEQYPEGSHSRFLPGWVLLGAVFAFLIFSALASYFAPKEKPEGPDLKGIETQIRMFFTLKPVMEAGAPPGSKVISADQLKDVFDQLEPLKKESPEAAELLVALRHEADLPTRDADLESMRDGKSADLFREVYGSVAPSKEEAQELQKTLTGDSLATQLAKIHALERAELPAPQREEIFSKSKALKVLAIFLGGTGLVFMGLAAWAAYFGVRRSGEWKPLGHPATPLTAGESDWFAFRAAALIVLFYMVGIVGHLASGGEQSPLALALPGLIFLPLVYIIYNHSTSAGIWITLQRIGVRKRDFGRHVLWGIGAWLAAIPLLAASTFVIGFLLRFLPTPTHPATELLQDHPETGVVLALLFMAAIVAPIWEEIMFRGTLLPAVARITKSPAWGIIISSFLFAAIHPQGLVLWLSLATIGAMAAMVTYQTKSLVPAMVLHAVHNFATLMVGLLISSM